MDLKLIFALVLSVLSVSQVLTQDVDDFDVDDATVEVEEDTSPSIDVPYDSPTPLDKRRVYFADHFDDPADFSRKWTKSEAKKDGLEEEIAKYDGVWKLEAPQRDALTGDLGLVLKSKAKHAAISSKLQKPFVFKAEPLIVQYEVMFQDGQECGGAYLKLLSSVPETKNLEAFHDKTPYSIMFGPDKCGNDHKLHFIFKHRNPLNGSVEEKHCNKPKERIEEFFSDKLPHLYTLVLNPDNTFEIKVDKKVVNSGSLLEDFTPAVNPPAEVDDPNDKKPEDWDEREKIPDPEAVKPDDWDEDAPAYIPDTSAVMPEGWLTDEPAHVPDPEALKPADWDSEMDGEWEPPMIDNPLCSKAPGCGKWETPMVDNPAYKGKWRPPMIDNPNYKGKWRPKRIPNPDYFEDKEPFRMQGVGAVGFELWSMSQDILFDNIMITDSIEVAEQWAQDTFDKKRQKIAKDSKTVWGRIMRSFNYRPKAWGMYFIYCSIPIVLYVWYLWSFCKEESIVQRVASLTNEYPVLWLVYIVVLGIPVALVLYCCCRTSKPSYAKEQNEQKTAAERKKTDKVTPDAVEPVEVEDEEENAAEEEEIDREKYSDQDDDDEEDELKTEVAEEKKKEPAVDGTRKRKPRKE